MTYKSTSPLPEDAAERLRTLEGHVQHAMLHRLRDAGWTISQLAEALGQHRSEVRAALTTPQDETVDWNLTRPIPHRGVRQRKLTPSTAPARPEPSPESLARLLELQPLAAKVRANGKRYRLEAEEYAALLAHVVQREGVSVYRLARRLGVTHNAVRFRMMRYGYLQQPEEGRGRVYQPLRSDNRPL